MRFEDRTAWEIKWQEKRLLTFPIKKMLSLASHLYLSNPQQLKNLPATEALEQSVQFIARPTYSRYSYI